jgi:hypothetical protein
MSTFNVLIKDTIGISLRQVIKPINRKKSVMKMILSIIALSSLLYAADSTDVISKRLVELQNEHKRGIEMIQKLQNDLTQTQQSVLRIEGAIAVLEEIKTAKGEKK